MDPESVPVSAPEATPIPPVSAPEATPIPDFRAQDPEAGDHATPTLGPDTDSAPRPSPSDARRASTDSECGLSAGRISQFLESRSVHVPRATSIFDMTEERRQRTSLRSPTNGSAEPPEGRAGLRGSRAGDEMGMRKRILATAGRAIQNVGAGIKDIGAGVTNIPQNVKAGVMQTWTLGEDASLSLQAHEREARAEFAKYDKRGIGELDIDALFEFAGDHTSLWMSATRLAEWEKVQNAVARVLF
eukprot:Hpha_TRINITY_DN12360_c0_g1::TRINITY_DN12360_c0_g1_i1::g.156164::m.156164